MIYSFAPIVNSQTTTLILGTMPGAVSLEKQEYYANNRNHFWPIIYALLGKRQILTNYQEKILLLQSSTIGLWDVLKQCERKGSLDTHIKNYEENDFSTLFKEFPAIRKLVFNGKESHRYFLKKYGLIEGISYYVMPSSSPANTIKFDYKLDQWSTILK
jgi:hypoxanthine-DNA glycosylase